MRKRIKVILIAFIAVAAFIQIAALIKCEILTNKYYSDFEYACRKNSMLGEMEYFKVLECDGIKAKVYYVEKDKTTANVLFFEKTNDDWNEIDWETVWSTGGSASNIVWPYWWHFIDGGF